MFPAKPPHAEARYFDMDSIIAGIGRKDDLTNHAVTLDVNYRL